MLHTCLIQFWADHFLRDLCLCGLAAAWHTAHGGPKQQRADQRRVFKMTTASWVLTLCVLARMALHGGGDTGAGSPALFNSEKWLPLHGNYEPSNPARPPPPTSTWQDPNAEIFVSLAEYRDSRCPLTL